MSCIYKSGGLPLILALVTPSAWPRTAQGQIPAGQCTQYVAAKCAEGRVTQTLFNGRTDTSRRRASAKSQRRSPAPLWSTSRA